MRIIRIEATDSTNNFLKQRVAAEKLEEGTVVQAFAQLVGRGQAGNHWESEPGKNLTCSILFYPQFLSVRSHFLLSKVIALGVKETLEEYIDDVFIKWPNDIYVQDKKITGILIENELTGPEINRSIVGIGVNLNQELFAGNAPHPVSLKQLTGKTIDQDTFLEEMLNRIFFWYEQLKEKEIQCISTAYDDALYHTPGYYRFKEINGEFTAEIQSVADDGILHLKTDTGEERRYFFKEVSFIMD